MILHVATSVTTSLTIEIVGSKWVLIDNIPIIVMDNSALGGWETFLNISKLEKYCKVQNNHSIFMGQAQDQDITLNFQAA